MSLMEESAKIKRAIEQVVDERLAVKERECLRLYKATVVDYTQGNDYMSVRLNQQSQTFDLPFSTEAEGVSKGSVVWVATTYDDFRNAFVFAAWNFKKAYKKGDIYISLNEISPASLYGGTWEQIEGVFLYASNDNTPAGTRGGEKTHLLSVDEMPQHKHTAYGYVYSGDFGETSVVKGRTIVLQDLTDSVKINWEDSVQQHTSHNLLLTDTENTGNSYSHNNMPPYLSVYMWKRLS